MFSMSRKRKEAKMRILRPDRVANFLREEYLHTDSDVTIESVFKEDKNEYL